MRDDTDETEARHRREEDDAIDDWVSLADLMARRPSDPDKRAVLVLAHAEASIKRILRRRYKRERDRDLAAAVEREEARRAGHQGCPMCAQWSRDAAGRN